MEKDGEGSCIGREDDNFADTTVQGLSCLVGPLFKLTKVLSPTVSNNVFILSAVEYLLKLVGRCRGSLG